ncbi:MAG: DUF2785 domain-containing protein [Pseudomonadota bacterium]|nr:DUF2785 domain-containing protein [Pseudomonadota bacterium]
MRRCAIVVALALFGAQASAACPPAGDMRALKSAQWVVDDPAARQVLALGMLDCLADPDPVLRDDIGFESLQTWMRTDKLDPATVRTVRTILLGRLQTPDARGFAQPFAALGLAEVARRDRRQAFLTTDERAELVRAACAYLAGLRDYRGFDPREGWRHGVAHGADLMLQLSLNALLDKAAHQAMLAAIGSQVVAAGAHFYIYGEGERLMAPVFYLARRDTLSAAEWDAWLARVIGATATPPERTQAPLARRHNLLGFLLPLYASLSESEDTAQRARLLPVVQKWLKRLG